MASDPYSNLGLLRKKQVLLPLYMKEYLGLAELSNFPMSKLDYNWYKF